MPHIHFCMHILCHVRTLVGGGKGKLLQSTMQWDECSSTLQLYTKSIHTPYSSEYAPAINPPYTSPTVHCIMVLSLWPWHHRATRGSPHAPPPATPIESTVHVNQNSLQRKCRTATKKNANKHIYMGGFSGFSVGIFPEFPPYN